MLQIETLSQKIKKQISNETLCFFFLYLYLEFSAIINMAWSELVKLEAIFNSSIIFFYIPNLLTSLTILALIHFLSVFLSASSSLVYLLPITATATATATNLIYFTVSN